MYSVRLITGVLLWSISISAAAQQHRISLSLLPSSFLEPDGGLTMGMEYTLRNNWSILSDAGVLFFDPYRNTNTNYRNELLGYRVKPEIRRYFPNKNAAPYQGPFIALEALYKHVNYQRYDGLPVLDNLGNLAYTWLGGYRIAKDVYGISLKLGYRFFFTSRQKFGMEGFIGFGTRQKNFAVRDLPPGGSFDRSFFSGRIFNTHWREGRLPGMPAGLKLLWRLR